MNSEMENCATTSIFLMLNELLPLLKILPFRTFTGL